VGLKEVYVISNRDTNSMRNLDLWLEYVDTMEVVPLFERDAKEYTVQKIADVDWSTEPEYLIRIAKNGDLSAFNTLKSPSQYEAIFSWIMERGEKALLLKCFKSLLSGLKEREDTHVETEALLQTMLDFLPQAPFLSIAFASDDVWNALASEMPPKLGPRILKAHILSAINLEEFIVKPFKKVLSHIPSMSLSDFVELVELIALTVRSADVALDLLLECLEPESGRVLQSSPRLVQHFVRNLMGIALDHIDEASQPQRPRPDLLELKVVPSNLQEHPIVESNIRIDAPVGTFATTDHVRLTVANLPSNSPATSHKYSMDTLVEIYELGLARFRCFHPLPSFVEECSWELQNCGSFVTSKTMIDAVCTLASEPDECCSISPQIHGTESRKQIHNGNASSTEISINEDLNASQKTAVATALSSHFTCLWGPPGTGKTHTIVEVIKHLLEAPQGNRRILVAAPTHNAVDNVLREYLKITTTESFTPPLRVSTDVCSPSV
jgi:hypothetical protein